MNEIPADTSHQACLMTFSPVEEKSSDDLFGTTRTVLSDLATDLPHGRCLIAFWQLPHRRLLDAKWDSSQAIRQLAAKPGKGQKAAANA